MDDGPRLTPLGKIFLSLFMVGCAAGAIWLFTRGGGENDDETQKPAENQAGKAPETDSPPPTDRTTVRIAYGTEKKRWLVWAVEEFAKTAQGKGIAIELLPMGSLEGARATVKGDDKIHVWNPASSAYLNVFKSQWELERGGDPIAHSEELALSPMVFVMWKDRFDAFETKYGGLNFDSISQALTDPGGWNAIAEKPEWGFFKFGHTNPNKSNSGLLSLILMAHHFHDKTTPLVMKDIVNPDFQSWLRKTEGAVSGLINSTGTMMRDMVLKGPSTYDAIFVYENVAIDYLKNAEGRWGQLHVAYPKVNMWNNNPYYIINAPWSSSAEQKAARSFLDFLMSEPIQQQSLAHGFRPGNTKVSIKGEESPFRVYAKHGLKIDLPAVAQPPQADAISNLLTGWQRIRSSN